MSEELWYPEFGLRRNPFACADRRTEINLTINREHIEVNPVETKANKMISSQVQPGNRVLIVGPRGCGKSTTLRAMQSVYFDKPIVVAPKSLRELVAELLLQGLHREEMVDLMKAEGRVLGELKRHILAYIPQKEDAHFPTKYVCSRFPQCKEKNWCDFPLFNSEYELSLENVGKYLYEMILKTNVDCPLARWLVVKMFESDNRRPNIFV